MYGNEADMELFKSLLGELKGDILLYEDEIEVLIHHVELNKNGKVDISAFTKHHKKL